MGAEEKKIPNDLDRIGIDRNAPVGVFDSGIGGLTVAREIMRQIPEERIVYLEIRHAFLMEASLRTRLSVILARSSVSFGQRESRRS